MFEVKYNCLLAKMYAIYFTVYQHSIENFPVYKMYATLVTSFNLLQLLEIGNIRVANLQNPITEKRR